MAATDNEEKKCPVSEKTVEHGTHLKKDLRPSHYGIMFGNEFMDPKTFEDEATDKPWTEATTEEVSDYLRRMDAKSLKLVEQWPMPDIEGVKHTLYEAENEEGLLCDVTVTEPENRGDEPLVGMVYMHGGAFFMFTGKEKMFSTGNAIQALCGAVVMNVHYTQSFDKPFPAALNECVAALRWFHGKIEEFNMVPDAGFCLYGESAGGNLVIASTLDLIESGDQHIVSCIDASCPALHPWNVYPEHVDGIPEEMIEQQKKYLHPHSKFPTYLDHGPSWMCYAYAGSVENMKNGRCWPHFADDELLKQLPPIIIETNQCDLLAPEGKMMTTRLDGLGVKVKGFEHTGTFHSSEGFDMNFMFWHHYRFQLAKAYCVTPAVEETKAEEGTVEAKEQN